MIQKFCDWLDKVMLKESERDMERTIKLFKENE